MSSKLQSLINNPGLIFISLGHRGYFNWMDDELYLKIAYRIRMGKKLDLKNPQTFNEKLQWLKLHNRNPLCTRLVDKYEVRSYILQTIGEEYLIPLVGGPWNSFDEIDFDKLPDQFVLKCTHDSGGLIVCKNKAELDVAKAKRKIEGCLKHNFYWGMREWPYKNVKPRIIAEKYMEDGIEKALLDIKFFCFGGVPRIMYLSRDRADDPRTDFFDMNYCHLNMRMRDANSDVLPDKPINFEQMKQIATKLSKGHPHVRVDFYEIDKKVYIGELTFFHCSGFTHIYPEKWEKILGDWIELP